MKVPYRSFLCLLGVILCAIVMPAYADNDPLMQIIQLPQSKGSVYKLLGLISDRSGFLFIYDSQVIDNDRETKIKGGSYTLSDAIKTITTDEELRLQVIGRHILLFKPEEKDTTTESITASPVESFLMTEGRVLDKYNDAPIPYATVSIPQAAIGTITNQNGEFRFRFPDSLRHAPLQIAHLGYSTYEVEAGLMAGHHQRLALEPVAVSLQEVVVRVVNPEKVINEMLAKRRTNYSGKPVYHTVFYREGVGSKKKMFNLTEAVFQLYKTPHNHSHQTEQVKLLKMRQITNPREQNTVITKFKAGINTCLLLDMVKNLPDFLQQSDRVLYDYAHTDIRVMDDRLAHVISFEQKKGITSPLYQGEIYIDTENSALLGGSFQIHPDFVKNAAALIVDKKSWNLNITPEQIIYMVSYKENNGVYYLNHIRGNLQLQIQKPNKLFSTTANTWFEMVVCKTETQEVQPFTRAERLPTRSIFSETRFEYDPGFWENFNIILPEESLSEKIRKISSIIEETEF